MARQSERGFTIAEVLIATAILSIGLVAVLAGTTVGFVGVDASRRSSTALFLAEDRLEQARAFTTAPTQGFAALVPGALPDEAYNGIAGYAGYRRTVTVTNNSVSPLTGAVDTKFVQVSVFYRPANQSGLGPETSVIVSTLLADHQ